MRSLQIIPAMQTAEETEYAMHIIQTTQSAIQPTTRSIWQPTAAKCIEARISDADGAAAGAPLPPVTHSALEHHHMGHTHSGGIPATQSLYPPSGHAPRSHAGNTQVLRLHLGTASCASTAVAWLLTRCRRIKHHACQDFLIETAPATATTGRVVEAVTML